ncbi:cytochrome P450 [Streptomyces sp. NPDC050560]|uniref:cytochrome P450 n=1 Tax=Streptomyces sp. NPDC050560 TaxID=3365630 RepID=UPI0037B4298B
MPTSVKDGAWTVGAAPGALPVLGHSRQMRQDPLGFLSSLHQYGDIVSIRMGPTPLNVLCRHDLAHHLMVERSKDFGRGGPFLERSKTVMGNGLATSTGPEHMRQRRMSQPAFHSQHIKSYMRVMQEEATAMAERWQPGEEVDIIKEMHDLTTRVTLRCFFTMSTGGSSAQDTVSQAADSLDRIAAGMYQQMTAPLAILGKLPTAANRRHQEAVRQFDETVDRIIADQRRTTARDDLLGLLMAARDEETGSTFSDTELHDQVITFLAAGIDTTANTLSWALGLTAQYPDVQQRFQAEIDELLDGEDVSYESIRSLSYTNAILDETLRMYPPLWMLTRRALRPTTLGPHKFSEGTQFAVSPYALQRDPRVFDEPEVFDPDRRGRQPGIPRSSFIPFGAGVHKCIGDAFALTESTIAMATIAQRWHLRLAPESNPVKPLTEMTLGPASVRVTPVARKA